MEQLELFSNTKEGEHLRDIGMMYAVDHADAVVAGWSEQAYNLLIRFITIHRAEFMAEMFRDYCVSNNLPEPPSLRAYGSVIRKAALAGKIKKVGHGQVNNPRAHMAFAAVWQAVV